MFRREIQPKIPLFSYILHCDSTNLIGLFPAPFIGLLMRQCPLIALRYFRQICSTKHAEGISPKKLARSEDSANPRGKSQPRAKPLKAHLLVSRPTSTNSGLPNSARPAAFMKFLIAPVSNRNCRVSLSNGSPNRAKLFTIRSWGAGRLWSNLLCWGELLLAATLTRSAPF